VLQFAQFARDFVLQLDGILLIIVESFIVGNSGAELKERNEDE